MHDDRRNDSIDGALAAYKLASDLANAELQAAHPIRLRLALNFSLFYHEVLDKQDQAVRVAQQALDNAHVALDELSQKDKNDSMLVIQLLQDNVTRWTSGDKQGTFHNCDISIHVGSTARQDFRANRMTKKT